MVVYTGLCTYPHGGYAGLGLLVASACAWAATTYAVASCRMFVVSFSSTLGCWQDYFSVYGNGGNVVDQTGAACKAGVGLYQWLHPTDATTTTSSGWPNGYCVGYQQSMRAVLTDTMFETARGFGVFAVLLGLFVHCWSLTLSCLELNTLQIWLLRVLCFCGMIATGMTFLFQRSSVCTELFDTRECQMDEGGLVMITGVILWFVCFLISACFLQRDPGWRTAANNSSNDKSQHRGGRQQPLSSRRRQQQQQQQEAENDSFWRQSSRSRRSSSAAAAAAASGGSSSSRREGRSSKQQQEEPNSSSKRSRRKIVQQQVADDGADEGVATSSKTVAVLGPESSSSATPATSRGRSNSNRRYDDDDVEEQKTRSKSMPAGLNKSKSRITVDDVSHTNEMEVFLASSFALSQEELPAPKSSSRRQQPLAFLSDDDDTDDEGLGEV